VDLPKPVYERLSGREDNLWWGGEPKVGEDGSTVTRRIQSGKETQKHRGQEHVGEQIGLTELNAEIFLIPSS
jgi:hypothetical protein